MKKPKQKPQPSGPGPIKPGDHPSKINKRITGLSFVRDMGKGRLGDDPRRQVQLLLVVAIPDDIQLPDHSQIVVEGDFNPDGTIHLNLHQHLVVDTIGAANWDGEEPDPSYVKRMRKSIKNMRIDQILTLLKWRV